MYYLLDLERTIATNIPVYWKQNKHGYTKYLEQSGLFSKQQATEIVESDFNKATVMIHQDLIFKILGKDYKQHEGIT